MRWFNGNNIEFSGRVKDYSEVITVSPLGDADFKKIEDALGSVSADGALIYVFPGTYTITSSLTCAYNVTIKGTDKNLCNVTMSQNGIALFEDIEGMKTTTVEFCKRSLMV